ncbi:MAG: hypothetical protein NTV61_03995 [Candidatus Bathyarchaeota archaeon]|nr:hypothetical protein [Candidatus Bathyarchaeota archaeon]
MSLRLLSAEEKRELLDSLAESYGFDGDELDGCEVLEGEEGYWAVSPEVITLPLRKLRTDSIGILLARSKDGGLAPTIAALQFFARPQNDALRLSQMDASKFIGRKAVAVDSPDGRHVVFCGDHALDLGRVREGRLVRVESGKPARKP